MQARDRNGFTLVESLVALGLFGLVTGMVWGATSVANRQTRQVESFTAAAQGAMLARATLGRDLERLVVLPGRSAAQVTSGGAGLKFLAVATRPGSSPYGVATSRTIYEAVPAPRGGVLLVRNGKPVAPVEFARISFQSGSAGSRHLVTARLELSLEGGGKEMTGRTAVVLVERSYGLPETYPGLKSFIAGK